MAQREPIFNFTEPAPVWLAGLLVLGYLITSFAPSGLREVLLSYALMVSDNGNVMINRGGISNYWSLALHALLHADFMHLIVNTLMITVFGVLVCRVGGKGWRRHARFLALFWLSVIAGGLSQWAFWNFTGETASALGASGGASGLFAAGAWVLGGHKKVLQFGLAWFVINMVLEFMGSSGLTSEQYAWPAHLGGFVAGAVLSMIMLMPSSTRFTITR